MLIFSSSGETASQAYNHLSSVKLKKVYREAQIGAKADASRNVNVPRHS